MDMTTSPPSTPPDGHRMPPVPRPVRHDLPARGVEVFVLVATALMVAGAGVPLGLLWSLLSRRVELVMTRDGAMYGLETEVFAAADGWFTLLTATAGLLAAVLSWLVLRRFRGPLMMLAVTLGAGASALLTSLVGSRSGSDDYQYLLGHAATGWLFPMPVHLGAKGALAVEALVCVLVYTVLAGCSRFPGLHPQRVRSTRPGNGTSPTVPVDGPNALGQGSPAVGRVAVPEPTGPGPGAALRASTGPAAPPDDTGAWPDAPGRTGH